MEAPLRRRGLAPVLLGAALAASVVGYLPSIRGALVMDDVEAIEGASLAGLGADALSWTRDRPLTNLSFALQASPSGTDTLPLHVVNVLIHLAASTLALAFARATFRRARHPRAEGLALFVAAAFALHPIQAEAVAYLSQRAEALAAALSLAAMLLLLRAEAAGSARRATAWAAAGTATFVLAVAAKPNAVIVPVAFLLHGATLELSPAANWRRRLAVVAPSMTLAASTALAVVLSLRGDWTAGLDAGELGPWRYFLTQQEVMLRYLRLLAWPAGLSIEHEVHASGGLGDPRSLAALAAVAGLISLAVLAIRRASDDLSDAPRLRVTAFGILFYLVALAPTSSIVPLADLMIEHRTYLANLGALAAAASVADWALARHLGSTWGVRVGCGAAATVIVALAIALPTRTRVFDSELDLWTAAEVVAPRSPRVHWNLAAALRARGDPKAALAEYLRAQALFPSSSARERRLRAVLDVNTGALLSELGRHEDARLYLERAITAGETSPPVHYALALTAWRGGRLTQANAEANLALSGAPSHPVYLSLAGMVAADLGDLDRAIALLRSAAALDLATPARLADLALAEERAGRAAEACIAWRAYASHELDARLRDEALRPEFDEFRGHRDTRLNDFGYLATPKPKYPRHTT
ncbi:MAG TPA: tetratricopeptide repeat protein [Anaeromyxobacter sp.]